MEIIATILLVLFTIEIIFIFFYASKTDDSDSKVVNNWGPPELPTPPGNTNIYELPDDRPPIGPNYRPGYIPRDWDDDYDFDGDFKKENKLRRIKFFLADNYNGLYDYDRIEVESDFNKNKDSNEYTVRIDKIDINKNKDKKLFMVYKPRDLMVEWKLSDEDNNVIRKDYDKDGDVKIGKLSELNKKANGKNLLFKVKARNKLY